MLDRIRLTLWDALTFFLTGLLVGAMFTVFWLYEKSPDLSVILEKPTEVPTSIVLFVVPVLFALIGLLVEPFANYFDRLLFNNALGRRLFKRDQHGKEEEILISEIKENYLGNLGGKIQNPFHICKDYVESKSLSPTFEIFLARFGFYRNCSFVAALSGVYGAIALPTVCEKVICVTVALVCIYVFKKRSAEFYSYQGPAVYRAFLVDKLKWVRNQSSESSANLIG